MAETINRRRVLKGAGTGAAALAMGALWRPTEALADHERRPIAASHLTIDVACLGHRFVPNMDEALDLDGGDLRGIGFYVEGYVYPAGTIATGDGFDPTLETPTGLWLCRGWFMFGPDRDLPHVITTQEYLFGEVSGDHPSPANQLVSSGVEGGVEETVRSVIGGTGRYRRTRGEVVQTVIGTNTTTLNVFEDPAPNFRFRFFN